MFTGLDEHPRPHGLGAWLHRIGTAVGGDVNAHGAVTAMDRQVPQAPEAHAP